MRFGYWMPIFGGWLRNVADEQMPVAWPYLRDLAVASEDAGFSLSLIAELNLNDIKGHRAPSLDCWTLAPAIAAATRTLELMLAVRPNYHSPALTAKALSTLDVIAPGRVSPERRVVLVEGRGRAVRRAVRRARRAVRADAGMAGRGRAAAPRGHRDPLGPAVPAGRDRARAQAVPPADGLHGRRVAQGQGGHRGPGRRVRDARRRPRGHRRQGGRPERPPGGRPGSRRWCSAFPAT